MRVLIEVAGQSVAHVALDEERPADVTEVFGLLEAACVALNGYRRRLAEAGETAAVAKPLL